MIWIKGTVFVIQGLYNGSRMKINVAKAFDTEAKV